MSEFDGMMDFGFTLVDEDELDAVQSAQEKLSTAQEKVSESISEITETQSELEETTEKLNKMYQMIQPLLMNLAQDPEKEYILWPERVEKIKQFKEMVDAVYLS